MAGKTQMIEAIAIKAGLTKSQADDALDALLETMTEYLSDGESVRLTGFGSFSVIERDAREGRDPRTGEPIVISAKKVVRFKIGSVLEEHINP